MDADGFGASRIACINKINALRATDTAIALQPYTLIDTPTTDSCVDGQATTDQAQGVAHYSFMMNAQQCSWNANATGFAQDECLQGYGTSPSGIEACLQAMWDESQQPNCAGCIGCSNPNGCANCDYFGMNGPECGHYVNMSAPFYTQVACGFAGAAPSSAGGWSAQNFE